MGNFWKESYTQNSEVITRKLALNGEGGRGKARMEEDGVPVLVKSSQFIFI